MLSDAPLRKMTHELATIMNIEPLFMDPYQSAWRISFESQGCGSVQM